MAGCRPCRCHRRNGLADPERSSAPTSPWRATSTLDQCRQLWTEMDAALGDSDAGLVFERVAASDRQRCGAGYGPGWYPDTGPTRAVHPGARTARVACQHCRGRRTNKPERRRPGSPRLQRRLAGDEIVPRCAGDEIEPAFCANRIGADRDARWRADFVPGACAPCLPVGGAHRSARIDRRAVALLLLYWIGLVRDGAQPGARALTTGDAGVRDAVRDNVRPRPPLRAVTT